MTTIYLPDSWGFISTCISPGMFVSVFLGPQTLMLFIESFLSPYIPIFEFFCGATHQYWHVYR